MTEYFELMNQKSESYQKAVNSSLHRMRIMQHCTAILQIVCRLFCYICIINKDKKVIIKNIMKVLKFGGASVGSIKNLQQVKKIIEGVNEPAVILSLPWQGHRQAYQDQHTGCRGTLSYVDEFRNC